MTCFTSEVKRGASLSIYWGLKASVLRPEGFCIEALRLLRRRVLRFSGVQLVILTCPPSRTHWGLKASVTVVRGVGGLSFHFFFWLRLLVGLVACTYRIPPRDLHCLRPSDIHIFEALEAGHTSAAALMHTSPKPYILHPLATTCWRVRHAAQRELLA
jgi:hypothetical protein